MPESAIRAKSRPSDEDIGVKPLNDMMKIDKKVRTEVKIAAILPAHE
jgi:hypothetical protein